MAARADVRAGFTLYFLGGASALSREAFKIETMPPDQVTEDDRVAHRGYVVGAIMEAVSALETEAWEVLHYGPGNHLGSDGMDQKAKALLAPLAELVDTQDVLTRYETILHLLSKTPLDRGSQPAQDVALLLRLRNETAHFKSRWGQELDRAKFIKALRSKKLAPPPFVATGSLFFPHLCLSAACAAWAVDSSAAMIDWFYVQLGITSPLDPLRGWIRPRLL